VSAELERREIVGVAICRAMQASCTCALPAGHIGPHVCESAMCGGSWSWDDGKFRIHRLPSGGIFGPLLDALAFPFHLYDDEGEP
jgi:hypothetical protein